MARIGQCFSTSMDAVGIDVNEGTSWDMDEDIKTSDGSYCFSDGVGRISQSLAQQVTRTRNSDVFWSPLRSKEVKNELGLYRHSFAQRYFKLNKYNPSFSQCPQRLYH